MPETVLITGASSGIGRELAHVFARHGSDLVLLARREEKLRTLADELSSEHRIGAEVLTADLATPGAAEGVAEALAERGTVVDVLVNNAGFGQRGAVAEISAERQVAMIHLNVTALTHLTRLLLPGMLARGRGGILNVASTAAFVPGPYMSVYYATKAYVLSFSEGLAEEVAGSGVTVSCLCPGATATEFADRADMHGSRLFEAGTMPAAAVAEAGYAGFRRGEVIVLPGAQNRLIPLLIRLVPRAIVRKITKSLQA